MKNDYQKLDRLQLKIVKETLKEEIQSIENSKSSINNDYYFGLKNGIEYALRVLDIYL